MVFKEEDGTGLPDATSYVDIAFADAYMSRASFTLWSEYAQSKKEGLLEDAGQYADLRWGNRLGGTLLKLTQSLLFPRSQLTDRYSRSITGVPVAWKQAVCEYAINASKGSLIQDGPVDTTKLKKKKTVVGPITTEKEFIEGSGNSPAGFKEYPKADLLVKQFLNPSFANGGKVMRN